MRIAVLQFCPFMKETIKAAIERVNMEPIEVLCNHSLEDFSGYVVGGTPPAKGWDSYIQAIRQQSNQGKPILGVGQGAKMLAEAGLVPGIKDFGVGIALIKNNSLNTLIQMRLCEDYQYNAFTRHIALKDTISIAVRNEDNCFVIPPGLLMEMQIQGLGVFYYSDVDYKEQKIIAAVSNKAGNVMALVPYPEKESYDVIFKSMRDYIAKGHVEKVAPLFYTPR